MKLQQITKLSLLVMFVDTLSGDTFLQNNYSDISYDSSKNAITVGATTATAKGYSAILSNPAGLSSHANASVYTKTVLITTTTQNDEKITQATPANQVSVGVIYDSLAIEYKLDDYVAFGAGYGYETRYGLFSIGGTYLMDTSSRTTIDNGDASELEDDKYVTGDYAVFGLMWQKTFVMQDKFYGVYLGYSHKGSGKYDGSEGNPNIIPISPLRVSYGLGVETNIYSSSVLMTVDYFEESWLSHSETRTGIAYGLKWHLLNKLALGCGMSTQTNNDNLLGDMDTLGGGIEYSILGLHFNASYLQRKTYKSDGSLYLTDDSAHLDVALSF